MDRPEVEKLMRTSSLILAVGLASVPVAARASVGEATFQVSTGADLATLCGSGPGDKFYTAAQNFCEGFTVGVYRVLVKEEEAGGLKTICLPEPMPSRNQAVASYVTFVGSNPSVAGEPAEDSVLLFLQHQYPCSAKSPQ